MPQGRRFATPPRRVPSPANDNRGPWRHRAKQVLFLAAMAVMAWAIIAFR
jgi:hypothetical protein